MQNMSSEKIAYENTKQNYDEHIPCDNLSCPTIKELQSLGNNKYLYPQRQGWKFIHFAAWFGDMDFIKKIFGSKKPPKLLLTDDGWTPVHVACYSREIPDEQLPDVIEQLRAVGIDLTATNNAKENIFHSLIRAKKSLSVIESLLLAQSELKPLLFAENNTAQSTPQQLADALGLDEIVQFIKKQELIDAIIHDDLEHIKKCLVNQPELLLGTKDLHGNNVWQLAVKYHSLQAIDYILEETTVQDETFLFAIDKEQNHILHIASQLGFETVLQKVATKQTALFKKYLLSKNQDGNSPIHVAAIHAHQHLITYFFRQFKDEFFKAAAKSAANNSNLSLAQLLVKHGYNTDIDIYRQLMSKGLLLPIPVGGSASDHVLLLAIRHGNSHVANYLLTLPAVKTNQKVMQEALSVAIKASNDFKLIDSLLSISKNNNIPIDYKALLFDVIEAQRSDLLEYLLIKSSHKLDFSGKLNEHNGVHTPYTFAVSLCADACVNVFLAHKLVALDQKDVNGVPAIFWAIKNDCSSTVELLCERGAVLNIAIKLPGIFLGTTQATFYSPQSYAEKLNDNYCYPNQKFQPCGTRDKIYDLLNNGCMHTDAGYNNVPNSLVLQGGGEKGFCDLGAYDCLAGTGMIDHIRHVSGTSIGAIFGAFIALKINPQTLFSNFFDKKFIEFVFPNLDKSLLKTAWQEVKKLGASNGIEIIVNLGKSLWNLSKKTGLAKNHLLRDFIEQQIYQHTGIAHMTLGQLARAIEGGKPYAHVYIPVTNYVTGQLDIFSSNPDYHSSQNAAIFDSQLVLADVVAASGTFPGVFEAAEIRKKETTRLGTTKLTPIDGRFGDGGMLLNFPYKIFMKKMFIPGFEHANNKQDISYNPHVLGLRFVQDTTAPVMDDNTGPQNIFELIRAMVGIYMNHEDAIGQVDGLMWQQMLQNSINITSPVGTFNLFPMLDPVTKQKAVEAGITGVQQYLGGKVFAPETKINLEYCLNKNLPGMPLDQNANVNPSNMRQTPPLKNSGNSAWPLPGGNAMLLNQEQSSMTSSASSLTPFFASWLGKFAQTIPNTLIPYTTTSETKFGSVQTTLQLSVDPLTGHPVYDYSFATQNGDAIGGLQFYGQPALCQSEDGTRHNLLQATGFFAGKDPVAFSSTCELLPKQLTDVAYVGAQAGIPLGVMGGLSQGVSEILVEQGVTTAKNGQWLQQGLFYGGYFVWRVMEISQQQSGQEGYVTLLQAGTDTVGMLITSTMLSQAGQWLQQTGDKLKQTGYSTLGTISHTVGSVLPYARYTYDGVKSWLVSPTPTKTGVEVTTQIVTTVASSTIVQKTTHGIVKGASQLLSVFGVFKSKVPLVQKTPQNELLPNAQLALEPKQLSFVPN